MLGRPLDATGDYNAAVHELWWGMPGRTLPAVMAYIAGRASQQAACLSLPLQIQVTILARPLGGKDNFTAIVTLIVVALPSDGM